VRALRECLSIAVTAYVVCANFFDDRGSRRRIEECERRAAADALADLLVVDEAHRIVCEAWLSIAACYGGHEELAADDLMGWGG